MKPENLKRASFSLYVEADSEATIKGVEEVIDYLLLGLKEALPVRARLLADDHPNPPNYWPDFDWAERE